MSLFVFVLLHEKNSLSELPNLKVDSVFLSTLLDLFQIFLFARSELRAKRPVFFNKRQCWLSNMREPDSEQPLGR